jgi:deaminated glutathione amidase
MKVSLIQMNSINDKAANIAAAEALIERAVAEESPDWVLLPEQFDWAGGSRAEKLAAAERLPGGPAYEMARGQAIKHRIFVHAGSIMEAIDGEDRYHNTSVVFNREGEEIARYRKIHLFDVMTPDGTAYKESATVKAGDQVVTYDCEGVTVGCSICYDLRFPDLFQALAEKGAEMIAMPARSRSATSSGTLTAIPWSPTLGAMWSPRPPTALESSRPGSTRPGSRRCAG